MLLFVLQTSLDASKPSSVWQYSGMAQASDSETLDSERLLCYWRWLCPQSLTVIQRNAFGDLFLRDEVGRVHMLDVGSGNFSLIAESVLEFTELAMTPEGREEWFAGGGDECSRGTRPSSRSRAVYWLLPSCCVRRMRWPQFGVCYRSL
jgi:hypothetical protein